MAINDEIAAGVKPIQIENPLNNMVKFSNIQNDMANMALHNQKMEASTAAAARQGELDRYLAGGGRDESVIYGLGGVKDLAELRQGETAKRLGEKTVAETDKIHDETAAQAYRNISQNPSPENIIAHNQDYQLNPNNSPERKARSQRTADMLVSMPLDQRVAYLASQGASAADLKQHIGTVNAGGSTVTTSTNPYSGKTIQVGEVAHTLPPEQAMYAPTDLEDKQARYKALAKQTADQAALIARAGTAGLPGTADMLAEQQKARTAEQDALRGQIDVLQKQGQSVKHASAEFLQVSARLEQLRAAGQENGPEGKALQARIAKETYIPPVSSELSPDQNDALYGPNGAVTQGRLDPYKVNGRNAKIYANAEIGNPGTNMNQLAGTAALNRNAPFMAKQQTIEMLPTMLTNMSEAGKKLNFNDNKYFGAVQAWYKGASNDPDFITYMAQRNDVLLTLMGAMRSVGASDLAHRAEIDAAPQNMSPRAFDAYVKGQYKALEPRLAQAAKFTGSKPPAETSNAPAKTVTGQTVKNW